jgi:hypothetical protein
MSDPAGEQKPDPTKEPKPDDSIKFAEFLESKPPGAPLKISDLMVLERYQSGGSAWKLNNPRLHLHCDSAECSGLRYFRFTEGVRQVADDGELQTFLTYLCSNCRKTKKNVLTLRCHSRQERATGRVLQIRRNAAFRTDYAT